MQNASIMHMNARLARRLWRDAVEAQIESLLFIISFAVFLVNPRREAMSAWTNC